MSETKQVALRIETSFYERISKLAKYEGRSLHAQIVYMLRAFFDTELLRKRLDDLEHYQQEMR